MEFKCSICIDTLFSVNSDVSVTPCGHLFHKTCLEGSMQNNLLCPNCKTKIGTGLVKKIHPDVFDDLVYSDCSIETENFLEEFYKYEKEKRVSMLIIIKTLDKENTSLKKTNKRNQQTLKTTKLFFKGFQTENKKWQEKIQKLKLEHITLLAETRNVNNDKEVLNNISEDTGMDCLGISRDEGNHNDYKGNILQTLDDDLDSLTNKKRGYNGISDDVQKYLKEFDENDNKITELLLKKIIELENENKLLKETNKSSQTDLKSLETRLGNAQIERKNLKETYKKLQEDNKNICAKLENTKEMVEKVDADLSKELPRRKTRKRDENANNKIPYCNKFITNEGLLINYQKLWFFKFFKYVVLSAMFFC